MRYQLLYGPTGMAPSKIKSANQEVAWQRLYGADGGRGKLKLRVGDRVRISKAKRLLKKRYMANWSEEFFTNRIVKSSQ